MDMALTVIGSILSLVGWIWIVIAAFKDSPLWGILSFCVPIVSLVYGIMHWADLKVPTILLVVGTGLSLVGGALK